MIVHDMDQGSPEWFAVRAMMFTASHAQAIASGGDGLKSLCKELLIERHSICEDRFSNEHTDRGHELEDGARLAYELKYGVIVKEVGFCTTDENEHIGCSPDGLVGEDGMGEIKSLAGKAYLDILLSNKIPKTYQWQQQHQMWVCGRKWNDFIVYNPNFTEKPLIVIRNFRDDSMITQLKMGVKKGVVILREFEEKYNTSIQMS